MSPDPHEQILAHCQLLHDRAEGVNGVLVVSVFYANPTGDNERPGSVTHHRVGEAEGMADTIRAHLETPNANVYVGLQVMKRGLARGSRGYETDIVAVLGLCADMDADTGKVGGLPLPPSYSIETSPGNEQPVWLFDRPLTPAEAKPLAAALHRATGSDTGTKDLTHVWRVPGTLNWPNKKKLQRGRSPDPAEVIFKQEFDGSLVTYDDMSAALAGFSSPEKSSASAAEIGDVPDHVDADAEIMEMLAGDGVPDRSAHAARVIEKIAFAGHSVEEAVALVTNCTGAWRERYRDDDHIQKDVARLWAKFGNDDKAEMIAQGARIADTLVANFIAKRKAHSEAMVPANPPPEESAHLIKATPFVWTDPRTLPRREFLFGTHLIRKYVSVTVAPGGLGKSSLTIAEALSMVTGRPLLGGGLQEKLRVWMFNAEDPRDELNRRIMAACIRYNISAEMLQGRLFVDSGREAPIIIAVDERDGTKIAKPVREAVVAAIKANQIDALILDPFVSTHRVNENDNGAVDAVAKEWGSIADECNIAIDVVHHVRKVSDRDATIEDARGAVSLLAASRSARVLNRMTREQAEEAGVSEDDRNQIFNIEYGKSTMSKLSSRRQWRMLESVALGNHGSIMEQQDHAAVVTEWEWPSSDEVLEDVSDDQFRMVKARVMVNPEWRYSSAAKTGSWIGSAIAEALGMDAKSDKKQIERMINAWVSAGEFVVEHRKPKGGNGNPIPFIRLAPD